MSYLSFSFLGMLVCVKALLDCVVHRVPFYPTGTHKQTPPPPAASYFNQLGFGIVLRRHPIGLLVSLWDAGFHCCTDKNEN